MKLFILDNRRSNHHSSMHGVHIRLKDMKQQNDFTVLTTIQTTDQVGFEF